MCITSLNATLKNTYVGVWDIQHEKYGYRHVLAYQNMPISASEEPNCMLLHIPSIEALSPENLLNTEKCPDFLKTMIDSVLPITSPLGRGTRSSSPQNHVIEMGIYHIAILNNLSKEALKESLNQIPTHKKPNIHEDFLGFFQSNFPNYPLLLCCFNNQDAKIASPIVVHFSPLHPDIFMLNTLDSHGHLPNIGEYIFFPQRLLVGSQFFKEGSPHALPLDISKASEDLKPFLPAFGYGFTFAQEGEMPNADILVPREDFLTQEDALIDFNLLPRFVNGGSID
jgi:hypothetical protein